MKFSIIVPIYNVEKYLNKCIESIINQTYTNFELILIDDGASDNCPQICDEWAKKDERIKVIHKKNEGVSVARNYGIDLACGDYLLFVDADDFINQDLLRVCKEKFDEKKVDSVIFNASFTNEEGQEIGDSLYVSTYNKTDYDFKEEKEKFDFYCEDFCGKYEIWTRCYRLNIIKHNKIYFPIGIEFAEDFLWALMFLLKSESTSYVDYIGYNYRQRDGSAVCKSRSVVRTDDGARLCYLLYNYLIENKFNYFYKNFNYLARGIFNNVFFPVPWDKLVNNVTNFNMLSVKRIKDHRRFIKKIIKTLYKETKINLQFGSISELEYKYIFHKFYLIFYAINGSKFCLKLRCWLLNKKIKIKRFFKK